MTAFALPLDTSIGACISTLVGFTLITGVVAAAPLHASVIGCASNWNVFVPTSSCAVCMPAACGVHLICSAILLPEPTALMSASQNGASGLHGVENWKLPSRSVVCR